MTALRRFFILLVVFAGLAPGLASAVQPDEILADSKLEARARGISVGLRCLVCQNQSIDDSSAELARDLRLLVRERLKAGDSDAQVRDFLVRRYGNFILLKPPFDSETALLWGMPALLFAAGAISLLLGLRRRRQSPPPDPLSQTERDRLALVLNADIPSE
jgi:cytochrome c-type biogenesis protein CcmH